MNEKEMEFQLLVKELEHADGQVSSYLDLQMKILGLVFTVLAAGVGLLLTSRPDEAMSANNLAKLLTIAAAVASFAVLQSSITYGIALGYMHAKVSNLAPRFQRLLSLSEPPLQAVLAFQSSPSRLPVFLATIVLAVGLVGLELALLGIAWRLTTPGSLTRWFVRAGFALLVAVVACQVLIGAAMRKVGLASEMRTARR